MWGCHSGNRASCRGVMVGLELHARVSWWDWSSMRGCRGGIGAPCRGVVVGLELHVWDVILGSGLYAGVSWWDWDSMRGYQGGIGAPCWDWGSMRGCHGGTFIMKMKSDWFSSRDKMLLNKTIEKMEGELSHWKMKSDELNKSRQEVMMQVRSAASRQQSSACPASLRRKITSPLCLSPHLCLSLLISLSLSCLCLSPSLSPSILISLPHLSLPHLSLSLISLSVSPSLLISLLVSLPSLALPSSGTSPG